MRKTLYILSLPALFFIITTLTFCKKKAGEPVRPDSNNSTDLPEPAACYKPSKCFVQIGDSVRFQNCSANDERSEWHFGDGSISTLRSPVHIFKNKGMYNVVLFSHSGTKSARTDTTVIYGMKASVTLTFSLSDWDVPPSYFAKGNTLEIDCYLYSISDTSRIVAFYMGKDCEYNSAHTFTISVPLADEHSRYRLKAVLYRTYFVYPPSIPDADMYRTEVFGTMLTDDIHLYGPAKMEGSEKIKIVTLNYQSSGTKFY